MDSIFSSHRRLTLVSLLLAAGNALICLSPGWSDTKDAARDISKLLSAENAVGEQIHIRPTSSQPFRRFGTNYLFLGPVTNAEDLSLAIANNPVNRWAYDMQGLDESEYQTLLSRIEKGAKSQSKFQQHYARAWCALRANAYQQALSEATQCLALDAHSAEAETLLAQSQLGLEKIDDALASLTKAAKLAPQNSDIAFLSGVAKSRQRKWTDCVTDLSRAIKSAPARYWYHWTLGYSLLHSGKAAQSQKEFETVAKSRVNDELALPALENYFYLQGTHEKIIDTITSMLASKPQDANLLYARASALCRMSEYERALSDLNAALKVDPHMQLALLKRGYVNARLRKHKDAAIDWEAANRITPTNTGLKGAAGSYFELADFKKAVDSLTKLIAATGKPEDYLARAACYDKLGKSDLANADRRQAEQLKKPGQRLLPYR